MWFGFILGEIVSGLMFSNAQTVLVDRQKSASNRFGTLLSNREADTCDLFGADSGAGGQLNGCPAEIPLKSEKILVAARIYAGTGNDFPSLSCNGQCDDYEAETKFTLPIEAFTIGSVIVNPGCTMIVFADYNYKGTSKQFPAGLYSNIKAEDPFKSCPDVACVSSMLFTCKQVLPSCTPHSDWQTVTTLDNTDSTVESHFTYKKTIGTKFSEAITNSFGTSVTVKAEMEAGFFDLFKEDTSLSLTIKYDWSKLDTEEKSTDTTFNVDVNIPPGLKVFIEEVVGTCGGSTIQTQMFRVVDSKKNTTLGTYQGKMKSYSLV